MQTSNNTGTQTGQVNLSGGQKNTIPNLVHVLINQIIPESVMQAPNGLTVNEFSKRKKSMVDFFLQQSVTRF
jgi:hypothetical protein